MSGSYHEKVPLIFIVDDDMHYLTSLAKTLARIRAHVKVFIDPAAVLEEMMVSSEVVFLLIADTRMPKMTGFELITAVKKISPLTKTLLISDFEIDRVIHSNNTARPYADGLLSKKLDNIVEFLHKSFSLQQQYREESKL